jgi:two-component system, LuxR family, sensor kinase FixL
MSAPVTSADLSGPMVNLLHEQGRTGREEAIAISATSHIEHTLKRAGAFNFECTMSEQNTEQDEAPSVNHYTALYNQIRELRSDLERETTARKTAEEGKKAAEELLREMNAAMIKHQLVGQMGDFRFNTVTGESRGSVVSLRMTGHDPDKAEIVTFEMWANSVHPDDRTRILGLLSQAIEVRGPMRFEYRMVVNGEVRHIRCDGEPDNEHEGDLVYYGVLTDITERKIADQAQREIESELAASLRLASMGELAGSIIHEINQPLAAISASADACRRWLAAGPDRTDRAMSSLERVIEESQRAASVVAGLKSLIRNAELAIVPLQADALLHEVASLALAELSREGVLLEMEIESELPAACGDRVQIQQVIMNLIRNAVEAMRASDRRILTLSASTTESEIVMRVADTGPGIDAAFAEKLFEPLYTTKPNGMGLGLAISRKIARAMGGRLEVESAPSTGATFLLALPVANTSGRCPGPPCS